MQEILKTYKLNIFKTLRDEWYIFSNNESSFVKEDFTLDFGKNILYLISKEKAEEAALKYISILNMKKACE